MNEKTCRLLEFDRIKENVASYAKSEEAAALIVCGGVETDEAALAALYRDITRLTTRLSSPDAEPAGHFPAIAAILPKLSAARAALSIEEAFALGSFLEEAARFFSWLDTPEFPAPDPKPLAGLAAGIFAVITRDGTAVRDLPEIKRIKSRIASLKRDIQRIAASFARDSATSAMLQDSLPSARNGRTVIAVKANFKGRIRGIVHEVSASGQTLFLEPEAVIEKNNALFIEERALATEILRLMRALTAGLAPHRAAIDLWHQNILYLETIRARARCALAERAVFAESVPREEGFYLKGARHPLLASAAVPIDLIIRAETRALIITGPNAGGKTAALKTAGLFALMHQSGFALPVRQARLPVFDHIFADIGDEQSLSGALSTFQAHIQNIAVIEQNATARSLILLDELGAGTGPEEGGALAMAFLDTFIQKNALLFVTTHTNALKDYGWTRPMVENASMEFDTATRLPTYRVMMGVPGESRAIPIAERGGIRPEIIAAARRYFKHGEAGSAKLIAGLREKITRAAEERKALDAERISFEKERKLLAEREARLKERELALKTLDTGKLRALLTESRRKLENLVRAIQEHDGALDRTQRLEVKQFLNDLEITVETEEARRSVEREELETGAPPLSQEPLDPTAIQAGMPVLAGPGRRQGTVKRQGKPGFWIVETGSVSMPFPQSQLFAARQERLPQPALVSIELASREPAKIELDLRGMRLAEALDALRRQLDAAALERFPGFAVIHGTGDGILQRGIHEFFKQEPLITGYSFSRPELGGTGRTEVLLR